ncbi:MAG: hypothetical protein PHQ59_00715 [Candidatus Daviesbacteria bacterium]|nr:hypothetical protein [Candidatus Daviesbacteria bacterium]
MSLESTIFNPVVSMDTVWFIVKGGLVVLSLLYFIFSLIVVRQINLMTDTLITEVAPYLRAFAIIHSGISLGIIILFIGFLFG